MEDRLTAPSGTSVDGGGNIVDRLSIGRGLSLIPNLGADEHYGSKIFVQTSFQHANTPLLSGLLTSIGKTSREALISKEPTTKHPPAFDDDFYFGYRSEIKN